MDLKKPLYKSNKNKIIDGVCGGIGEYFGIDPTLVRLGFVGLCILAGGGVLAYIVALIIIPNAPEGYDPAAQTAPETEKTAQKTDPAQASDGTADSSTDGDGSGSPMI